MRCLTEPEQKEWLNKNAQIEAPYSYNGSKPSGKYYRQFLTPIRLPQIEAFTFCYLESLWKSGEALLVVTDWALYESYEMRLIDLARSAHGEKRNLIEATGHLFCLEERDDLIALFSLSVSYQWKAYLYLSNEKTTLFNWEGEIFDFWSDDAESYATLSKLQVIFRLKKTGLVTTKIYGKAKKLWWRLKRLVKLH